MQCSTVTCTTAGDTIRVILFDNDAGNMKTISVDYNKIQTKGAWQKFSTEINTTKTEMDVSIET